MCLICVLTLQQVAMGNLRILIFTLLICLVRVKSQNEGTQLTFYLHTALFDALSVF